MTSTPRRTLAGKNLAPHMRDPRNWPDGMRAERAGTTLKRFFDDLYAEPATAPMFTTFQLHPYVSSRLGRTGALKEMIEYMKCHEGVWFATGIEIAEWWLKQNFSEKPAPLRIAAAS